MTENISVLIVDDNVEYTRLLQEHIEKTGEMYVKGIARDGIEAVRMIRELSPDVAILDIIMPQLDGIGVLERISQISFSKRPIIIVLTAIGKDVVVHRTVELGADYYVMKPFDMDMLILHIKRLYNEKMASLRMNRHSGHGINDRMHGNEGNTLEQIVASLIKCIGITPNIAGYRYLREAVVLSVNEPQMLNSVTKFIYPVLAQNNNTSVRDIDRAIRCAISSACNKTKNADNCSRNTIIVSAGGKKPGNALIIRVLAEKAAQKMKLIEEI